MSVYCLLFMYSIYLCSCEIQELLLCTAQLVDIRYHFLLTGSTVHVKKFPCTVRYEKMGLE